MKVEYLQKLVQHDLGLPREVAHVLLVLAIHAHDDGTEARPSVMTLMREVHTSESAIHRALVQLKRRGLIVPVAHSTGGRGHAGAPGRATVYNLHPSLAYGGKGSADDTLSMVATNAAGVSYDAERGATQPGKGSTSSAARVPPHGEMGATSGTPTRPYEPSVLEHSPEHSSEHSGSALRAFSAHQDELEEKAEQEVDALRWSQGLEYLKLNYPRHYAAMHHAEPIQLNGVVRLAVEPEEIAFLTGLPKPIAWAFGPDSGDSAAVEFVPLIELDRIPVKRSRASRERQ